MGQDAAPRNTEWTIRLRSQQRNETHTFAFELDKASRDALAQELGLLGLRKLRFSGALEPDAEMDWRLDAQVGATIVQACIATLEPVVTRIERPIDRRYVAEMPSIEEGSEIEMPDLDEVDALPAELDLYQVMVEALELALPQYPRANDAAPVDETFAEPGVTPMSDADTKPFAALAALRDKLQ